MNQPLFRLLAGLALLASTACIVPEGATPSTQFSLDLGSKYMHRGMVQNDRAVAQPSLTVDLPTVDDGVISVNAWGNLDLTNDTGDAWFPNGHEGRFSEIDFIGSYSKSYDGWDVVAGIHNYNLPNGLEFPFGERGATTELFATVGHMLPGELYGTARLHVDIDEAEGVYGNVGLIRGFDVGERLLLDLSAGLGWTDDKHALWAYGLAESGLADLQGSARLNYLYSARTTLHLTLSGSSIVDGTQSDWFDTLGIEPNNIWLTAGASWSL